MSLTLGGILLLLAAPAVGSFLGTLILRLPRAEPVALGRSRCPHCRKALTARDLVPLVSWLANGGRCRHCGAALGVFYPVIELAALVVALWSVAVFPGALAWVSAVLGWTLLVLAEIDRRTFWLPDELVLPLIPAGLAVVWLWAPERMLTAALGALAGFGLLAGVRWLYRLLRGREGLGLGDAKLFAAAGAWTTLAGLPSVLLYGALGGLIAVGVQSLRDNGAWPKAQSALPFGPFLALGLWLVWSFGPLTG